MPSIKDSSNIYSSGGYGTPVVANPTSAEIYLYDIIDDVRTWINKNKRNNITGRKIKPIMQGWLNELEKVYPHLSDKAVTNGKVLQTNITDIKAAIKRVLGKSDSELTFEYLAQFGTPDKSRQVFWNKFDTLFKTMSDSVNVVKSGSNYKKKNSTGPGVMGGNRPVEEKKNRWYGGAGILGGAGSNIPDPEPKNNEKVGPSGPLSSRPSPSSSSPSEDKDSGRQMGFNAPTNDDDDEKREYTSSPVGDALTREQASHIEDNEEYMNAYVRICGEANEYLAKVLNSAKEAYLNIVPGVKSDLIAVNAGIRSIKQLLQNMEKAVRPRDQDDVENIINTIENIVYNKNGNIDDGQFKRTMTNLGFIPPGLKFKVFEVDLNSTDSLSGLRIPNRQNNQQQGRGQGGNKKFLDPDDKQFKDLANVLESIRGVIKKNAKNASDIIGNGGDPSSVIKQSAVECQNVANNILGSRGAFDIVRSYSTKLDNLKGSLSKVASNCDEIQSKEDPKEIDRLIDSTSGILDNIINGLPSADQIKSQFLKLEPIVAHPTGGEYENMPRKINGDITAGSLIAYIQDQILKTSSNDSTKNIIAAYQDLTGDRGPSVKMFNEIAIVRKLVSREMIKMLHEMESYWD